MTWKAIFACGTLAAGLAVAAPASAQSAFDGTWKVDTNSAQYGGKPIERLLKDGTYSCRSCQVPYSIPADGAFHAIAGNPYVDEVAVTVIDANGVKAQYRKNGKITDTTTMTVSPDGRTLAFAGKDTSAANGTPVDYDGTQIRVGAAPAGAHALSGSWREQKGGTVSDAGLTLTIKTVGDAFTLSYPTGETVTATLGGPAAPIQGDLGNTQMKIARKGPNALHAESIRDGKVAQVTDVTVQPGGRTLRYTMRNVKTGNTQSFVATRQ